MVRERYGAMRVRRARPRRPRRAASSTDGAYGRQARARAAARRRPALVRRSDDAAREWQPACAAAYLSSASASMSVRPLFVFSLPRAAARRCCSGCWRRIPRSRPPSEPWILLPQLYALRPYDGAGGVRPPHRRPRDRRLLRRPCPAGATRTWPRCGAGARRSTSRRPATRPGSSTRRRATTSSSTRSWSCFPDARFVFLWRHPLAVAASMIDSFGRGHWNLDRYGVDLDGGLERLVAARARTTRDASRPRYEDVVADPARARRRVFEFLGLDPAMAATEPSRRRACAAGWATAPAGEPTATISREPLDRGSRRWATRFASAGAALPRSVGPDRLAAMGYDLTTVLQRRELSAGACSLRRRPRAWARRMRTLPAPAAELDGSPTRPSAQAQRGDRRPTVIFLHIGKTAGSTLRQILQPPVPDVQVLTVRARRRPREETLADFAALPRGGAAAPAPDHGPHGLRPPRARAAAVHLHHDAARPVRLAVSQYSYVLRTPGHRHHDAAQGMTLEQYVESGIALEMDNSQTRAIAGDRGHAVRRLHPRDARAGQAEPRGALRVGRRDRALRRVARLLGRTFGWSDVRYVSRNVAHGRAPPAEAELLERREPARPGALRLCVPAPG